MFLPLLSLISFEAAFLSVFLWDTPWYQQFFTISPLATIAASFLQPGSAGNAALWLLLICPAKPAQVSQPSFFGQQKSSGTKAPQEQIYPALYFIRSFYSFISTSLFWLLTQPLQFFFIFFFSFLFCVVVPSSSLHPQHRFLHTCVSLHLILSGHINL